MRFESVTANAFGPFADQTLELAPGFTIVHGPNESGKSTWHAAIYAGLCGQRRGKGKQPRHEQLFEAAHRPWSNDAWRVSARVILGSGRRVELTHDLVRKVDCRAVDLDFGRDISTDLIFEGAPDGSRLLGLDRRAFLATACVRQNELLALLDDPRMLQEYLQRAAATAATDGNAAAALAAIEHFRATQVGLDKATAVKPLRRAIDAVEAAQIAMDEAREEHGGLLALQAEAAAAERTARSAEHSLRVAEAGAFLREARTAQGKLEQARALEAELPDGPPVELDAQAIREREVAAALWAWRTRPEIPPVPGRTAAELATDLADLPALETNDTGSDLEPAEDVSTIDPALRHRVDVLRQRLDGSRSRRNLPALVVASLLGVGGTVAFALGAWYAAVPMCLLGAAIAAWVIWWSGSAGRLQLLEELREAEKKLSDTTQAHQQAQRSRQDAQTHREVAASRRVVLERAIAQQTALEEAAEAATRRRKEAGAAVIAAASSCGVAASNEIEAVAALEGWQRAHQERMEAHQAQLAKWTSLQAHLGGRPIGELEKHAWALAERAATARAGLDKPLVEQAARDDGLRDLEALRLTAAAAQERAAALGARASERASRARDVPAAEEALAAARAELVRVQDLAQILDLTRDFLQRAQERAHRDIAPVIRASIEPALAAVTGGRYPEARVDPENLAVTVRSAGGAWRDAARLSHGTTEQIYLLLRVALAEHLGDPEESCPLLLDDVTTHCDEERTDAVLDVLHRLSAGRQVILFSQQTQVAHWAERHLGGRDRLVRLERVPVS